MQFIQFSAARADTGAVLPFAKATVYFKGTTTPASLYSISGGGIANPTTADITGAIGLAAADGTYDIAITSADGAYQLPLMRSVQLYDLGGINAQIFLAQGIVATVTAARLACDADVALTHADVAITHSDRGIIESYMAGIPPPTALPAGGAIAANYATMTALLKSTLSSLYPLDVLGCVAAGDGGAGRWRWDPASTATPDGGMVLASNEGGSGRWLRAPTTRECWLEWFGVDMTGATQNHVQVAAWMKAGIANKMILKMGPGIVLLGAPTIEFHLTTERVVIIGAGGALSGFRKAPGMVTANGQSMFRFWGDQAYGGAVVQTSGISLDFNCENNFPPGGNLPNNFAWQHCLAMEFHPTATSCFAQISFDDILIIDPISDGISVRGGTADSITVDRFYARRVRNEKWGLTTQRPRVRGDITLTSAIKETLVEDCRLPRLHYELEIVVPAAGCTVTEINNACGEVLAHWAGNYGYEDRLTRNVYGGSIGYFLFQGNVNTHLHDVAITLNRTGPRLTGGVHRIKNGSLHFGPSYDASGVGHPSYAFSSLSPVASSISIVGDFHISADPAAVVPDYLVQSDQAYTGTRGLRLKGIVSTSTKLRATTGGLNVIRMYDTEWDYDGSGSHYGGALVTVSNASSARSTKAFLHRNRLNNPGAKLLLPPVGELASGAAITAIEVVGNITAPGMVFDLSSIGFGAGALTRLAAPFNPSGSNPSWTISVLKQDEQGEAKPTTGDRVRGQKVNKIGVAASQSPGWGVVASGPAASGSFVTLPVWGT